MRWITGYRASVSDRSPVIGPDSIVEWLPFLNGIVDVAIPEAAYKRAFAKNSMSDCVMLMPRSDWRSSPTTKHIARIIKKP